MVRAEALLAASLLLGVSMSAVADAVPSQIAQAGTDESLDAEYKKRIEAAQTPEEKDRLRTEYELRKRGGSIPDQIVPAQPVPGTSGSDSMPKRDGGPRSEPPKSDR